MTDLEMQQYLFDLQGFLVIENALSADEVATLNRLIDEQNLPPPSESTRFRQRANLVCVAGEARSGRAGRRGENGPERAGWIRLPQLGETFLRFAGSSGHHASAAHAPGRRLPPRSPLRHEHEQRHGLRRAARRLWRDRPPIRIRSPGEYYAFRANQIYEGFVVVAWALSDGGGEHGGFCCIPGSHKSNYKLPQRIRDEHDLSPAVVIPEMPAGSVILFTESLTHGTATWHAEHSGARCFTSIASRTWPGHPSASKRRLDVELTPRQQILLREPGDPLRHFRVAL